MFASRPNTALVGQDQLAREMFLALCLSVEWCLADMPPQDNIHVFKLRDHSSTI